MSRCDGCGAAPADLGPQVHDHVWQQITAPGERFLCDACMGDRAFERLGRSLSLADLRPCRFNLLHRPDSWFDQFCQWEERPPANLPEWQAAMAQMEHGT